jgi:hypothetical protein
MRLAVVPPAPVLLPEYASIDDPVRPLREAAGAAAKWIVGREPEAVTVIGDRSADGDYSLSWTDRIASQLLVQAGYTGEIVPLDSGVRVPAGVESALVLASGTGCRSERAPGSLDQRSFGYDEELERALRHGHPWTLGGADAAVGAELLCGGLGALHSLAHLQVHTARMDYADDPFGVRYWVVRWICES